MRDLHRLLEPTKNIKYMVVLRFSMKINIDYSIDMNMVTGIEDFLFQCKRLHFVA